MGRLIELEKSDLAELGGVLLENRRTVRVEERINPYQLAFDQKGEPNFPYEKESELGMAEYRGMRSMWELARDGCKYVFWLSPPGGRSVYTEGRLVVGKVVNEREIECRGIPILETAERMLEMANRISKNEIREAEDLREQAIGVNFDGNLWDFCEKIFGMGEVWEAIKRGEDVVRKAEVVAVAAEAKELVMRRFGKVDAVNSILAGAMFERIMAGRGYQIVGGNHGGTNTGLLGGAFNFMFNEGRTTKITANGERLSWCEFCHQWYRGEHCPYCSRNN